MKMSTAHARERAHEARFGILATVDSISGTHTVPVVFAINGSLLVIPVDTVKDKTSLRLRRIENLENEPRASMLIDHRDDDWGQLWWVRIDLVFERQDSADEIWGSRLASKYLSYQADGAIDSLLHFTIDRVSGWQASDFSG
ncbi:MAG: pyridoxamine 5'-phosphate oxidase family protein [Actinomycetota bacterium]|nr:pyridoxamine 5'-phosphate oxidase family protein [Actinomycetota bacterium]